MSTQTSDVGHPYGHESRIDKMRRFISSPLARRKSASHSQSSPETKSMENHKIFGTPIEILTQECYMPGNYPHSPSSSSTQTSSTSNSAINSTRSSSLAPGSSSSTNFRGRNDKIPYVITRLCHYIEESHGFMQEGLFRTSGNARLIEKLKASFDSSGDAPLETEGDIPSAAALLKLFLRELPVPLIPYRLHSQFLDTVQDVKRDSNDRQAIIERLKSLVVNLPNESYFLLEYLSRFLHRVATHESHNRMTPSSLGIIFGPNIFRITAEDYKGLREQSLTNQIVSFFITDYDTIFAETPSSSSSNSQPKSSSVSSSSSSLLTTTTAYVKTLTKLSSLSSPSPSFIFSGSSTSIASTPRTQQTGKNDLNGTTFMPINLDIPAIDSDEPILSPSPNQCSVLNQEISSKEFLLVIDKTKSVNISGRKRKESKFCSSPVVRSSSEERKKISGPFLETFRAMRRCSSYQNVSRKFGCSEESCQGAGTSNRSPQPPEPKRREVESPYGLTIAVDSRPSSLDLSDRPPSINQDYEPLKDTTSVINTDNQSRTFSVSGGEDDNRDRSSSNYDAEIKRSPQKSQSKKSNNECKENEFSSLPLLDLNNLHRNAEGELAVPSESRYFWSSTNESLSSDSLKDEESSECSLADEIDSSSDQAVSEKKESKSPANCPPNAATEILKRENTYEAPLSPSAYRGFLGQRAAHLDHTIPPSPPNEQERHFRANRSSYNQESSVIKDAKKKVQALKRRLKNFESEFEKETGYRPSHDQKMKSSVAKPLLLELGKYRKLLKELKEDSRMERTADFYGKLFRLSKYSHPSIRFDFSITSYAPKIYSYSEGIFKEMQKSLRERRYIVGRPETIEEMNDDQILDEKLDLQKSLLKYESVFGRPSKREDKVIMKPLYDRYRKIRSIVAKLPKSKESSDLQPILENVAMNFASPSHSPQGSMVKNESASEDNNNNNNINNNNNNDDNINEPGDIKVIEEKIKNEIKDDPKESPSIEKISLNFCQNLHSLPICELVKELHRTWRERQELRQTIRSFEELQRAHGKLNKEEKAQIEATYSNYKALKKKIRLLEALVTKYEKKS